MTACPVPTYQASDRKWALQGPLAGSTLEAPPMAWALNTEYIYMLLWNPWELRIQREEESHQKILPYG